MDDVIVVGAGPAGNNTALLLAEQGYKVTVIDSRLEIGNKPCTRIIGQECALQFPVPENYIYKEALSASFIAPNDNNIQVNTGIPQAYIIDRVSYVASFAKRAEHAGATFRLGERVTKIKTSPDEVTITTTSSQYSAKAVVVASGFGSSLVRQLGLGSVPDYVSGAQLTASVNNLDSLQVYLGSKHAPGFFSWIVPTTNNMALIGLMTRKNANQHLQTFTEHLQNNKIIRELLTPPSVWGIPLRPLKRTYHDRVIVVGDAAGQVKPTTGGGIYYALRASQIAAETLTRSLNRDDLSATSLQTYQGHWKDLLADELERGYSARRLYELLSDRQINAIMRYADTQDFGETMIGSGNISFDWHSHLIGKLINYPGINGILKLINPIVAKLGNTEDIKSPLAY